MLQLIVETMRGADEGERRKGKIFFALCQLPLPDKYLEGNEQTEKRGYSVTTEYEYLNKKVRGNFNKGNKERRNGEMVSNGDSFEGPRTVRVQSKWSLMKWKGEVS